MPTLYDRILEYLFDRQDENGYVNLFNDDFKDVDKWVLREKAGELSKLERIEIPIKLRILTDGGRTERERWEDENVFRARIKLAGVEYVNELRKNRHSTETKKIEVKAEQIGTLNLGDINNSGHFNQSSDDLSLKKNESKKQTKQPDENPKRKMNAYEKWTIILAVVSVVITIILKLLDFI
jgi:hypothetical protein